MAERVRDIRKGRRFGRWTVLGRAKHNGKSRALYWRCRCKCRSQYVVRGTDLRAGRSTQCRTCCDKAHSVRLTRHGLEGTKVWVAWQRLIDRYADEIPREWRRFENFLADVGHPPCERSCLVRVDPQLPISKHNLCWRAGRKSVGRVTRLERALGVCLTLTDWGRAVGLCASRVYDLVEQYGSIEEVFFVRPELRRKAEKSLDCPPFGTARRRFP